jgi:hypothetical protein
MPGVSEEIQLLIDLIAVPLQSRSLLVPANRNETVTHVIRIGHWVFTDSVRVPSDKPDLLVQTRAIMGCLERTIVGLGLSFSDVFKANTFYIGEASSEQLHDNMRIRSSYYQRPGPVSTGIPVLGLGQPGALIAVDLGLVTNCAG